MTRLEHLRRLQAKVDTNAPRAKSTRVSWRVRRDIAAGDALPAVFELVEAVKFYADPKRYVGVDHYTSPNQDFPAWTWTPEVAQDKGGIARAALAYWNEEVQDDQRP